MKIAALVFACASAWAQIATPVSVRSVSPCEKTEPTVLGPKIAPQTFPALESRFNDMLTSLKDPVDILGGTRALYLPDYGVIFTTDVSLVLTPGPSPFRPKGFTKEEIAAMHKRKLDQVPILKQKMRETMKAAALAFVGAAALQSKVEASRLQLVYAVRALYLGWEDTSGLPAQITMKATLAKAIAGEFQEEVQ